MRIVIIGAGLLGVTTAYFLRHHGMDVAVLEREGEAARGASYGNGGYMQASAPDPWNAPGVWRVFAKAWSNSLRGRGDRSAFAAQTAALPGLMGWGFKFLRNSKPEVFFDHLVKNMYLGQYSVRVMREINEREPMNYDWSDNGGLIIFRDEASLNGYRQVAEHVGSHGARFELVDRAGLVSKETALDDIEDDLVGAVYFPDDARADSRAFCQQLAKVTQSQGTEFHYNVGVTGIASNHRGIVVETTDERVSADAVVIAAGAHSAAIGTSLGLDIPIAPAKGYSISVPMQGWEKRPSHVIADMGVHAGVNPMGDILRVAGTAEFTGFRSGVSAARTEYLAGLVREIFPSLSERIDTTQIDPWGGHRPLSADGLPIIGAAKVGNVYLNTGHGGLGWTQAAGSAKALADTIAGVPPELDLAPYSIERFS